MAHRPMLVSVGAATRRAVERPSWAAAVPFVPRGTLLLAVGRSVRSCAERSWWPGATTVLPIRPASVRRRHAVRPVPLRQKVTRNGPIQRAWLKGECDG